VTEETPAAPAPAKKNGALTFALDFGPLLLFFLGSRFGASKTDDTQGPLIGTAVFMIAIIVAMIIAKWKLGRISPMMKLSAILVLGFGSLTLWFKNFGFIQHKATAVYVLFSVILLVGWFRSKPTLKYLLEQAYEGLTEQGWMKLSLNWGLFFAALAVFNEVLIPLVSKDTYITIKTFGLPAITFIFAIANVPMLMKNGLSLGEEANDTVKK
jgi:intracellular septation protein